MLLNNQLLQIYSKYLPYHVKTDKGFLVGLLYDGRALTKTESGDLLENNIQNIKLHLNPIERMIEEVDEYLDTKTTPLIELAIIAEAGVIWEPKVKGYFEGNNYVCGVRYRDYKGNYKALTYSSKAGFLSFSTTKQDNVEDRRLIMTQNTQKMYETLFELHINLFDTCMTFSAWLNKDKYIVKQNINTKYGERQVGVDP